MEALTQIAGQLGVDETFFYLFALVWVFFFVFSTTYLRPYQRLLHDRHLKTEGAKKEALDLTAKAEEKFAQYKARLKEVNDQARATVRASEEAAKKEESKIIGEASTKSKVALQNAQSELDAQRKATLDALSGEIAGIANDIASKAMGRPVSAR